MNVNRIFICVKDIQILIGKSYRTANREYNFLKNILGKVKEDKISIYEYCNYYNLDISEVKKSLNIK